MAELSHQNSFEQVSEFAFITGLLSSIDVMLAMPISQIIKTMPLAQPIEQALLNKTGPLGDLLVLITTFFTNSNDDVDLLISTHNIDKQALQQEFINASKWYSDLGLEA